MRLREAYQERPAFHSSRLEWKCFRNDKATVMFTWDLESRRAALPRHVQQSWSTEAGEVLPNLGRLLKAPEGPRQKVCKPLLVLTILGLAMSPCSAMLSQPCLCSLYHIDSGPASPNCKHWTNSAPIPKLISVIEGRPMQITWCSKSCSLTVAADPFKPLSFATWSKNTSSDQVLLSWEKHIIFLGFGSWRHRHLSRPHWFGCAEGD